MGMALCSACNGTGHMLVDVECSLCEGLGSLAIVPSESAEMPEAFGTDLADIHQSDDKGACLVNTSYFRAWRWLPEQSAKLTLWCLARDGSVLKTLEPVLIRSKPEKRKQPMTLFVDETMIEAGMSVEEIKHARIVGAMAWRKLSPQEKAYWTKKVEEASLRATGDKLQ